MGRSYFLRILLISALLVLCFSQGFGRNLMGLKKEESAVLFEEISGKARQMTETEVELTDYSEPEPNTNPRNGNLFTPPAPPPPPPPPAPAAPTPKESGY